MDSPGSRTLRNLRVLTGQSIDRKPRTAVEQEREIGIRFMMHVRGTGRSVEHVAACLASSHGLDVTVRELARRAVAPEEQRFLLQLPGIARADIPQNPFDLARTLTQVEGLDVTLVEPDIPTGVYAGQPQEAFASFPGGFCSEERQDDLAKDWHTHVVRAPAAWNLAPPVNGKRFGEGIRVGHPDTGWLEHRELDESALDLDHDYDVIDDDMDARDPMKGGWLLPSPGHGLGTGSVIVSGHATGVLMGIAPAATLVPIRTTTSVAQVFGGAIAEAIDYAIRQQCDVISISLGALFLSDLGDAIDTAIANNIVICAASGNCVPVIPFPAAYPSCIAVAATWNDDAPWDGSSEGAVVDVASPGVNVWVARRGKGKASRTEVGPSTGASPATATVAGAAALWLAFHGKSTLIAHYQGSSVRLQHVFTYLLHHTARTPVGWPSGQYGSGVLDIHALLLAPLPSVAEIQREIEVRVSAQPVSPIALIAGMTSLTEEQVNARVASLLGESAGRALAGDSPTGEAGRSPLDLHLQELMALLVEHRSAFQAFVDPRLDRAADLSPNAAEDWEQHRTARNDVLRYASEGFREAAGRANADT